MYTFFRIFIYQNIWELFFWWVSTIMAIYKFEEVQNLGFNSFIFIGFASFLSFVNIIDIPLKIIILDGICFFVGVSFLRVLRRFQVQKLLKDKPAQNLEVVRTLLIGAGESASYLLKDIGKNKNIHVVGALDDDESKIGAGNPPGSCH